MTNKTNNTDNQFNTDEQIFSLSSNVQLLKTLALMQYNNEDYFIIDGIAYEGNLNDYLTQAKEQGINNTFFCEWCADNLTPIEEVPSDNEKDNFLILTDEEADEKAAEYIKDSLWAFNASFIIDHSKLPYEAKEMVQNFQQNQCEGANETIEALIEDIDEFIADAISSDGRGHFINSYDGHENEETVKLHAPNESLNQTFYIYRIN